MPADPPQDANYCDSLQPTQRKFCLQDLPSRHALAVKHMDEALSRCPPTEQWRLRHTSSPTVPGPLFGTPPNSGKTESYYLWTQGNMSWADGAPVGQTIGVPGLELSWRSAKLLNCVVEAKEEPGAYWSFDRLGPMTARGGYDWHGFGIGDVGAFADERLHGCERGRPCGDGDIWLRGYSIGAVKPDPSAKDGRLYKLPLPPIHIHHMHVASSQNTWIQFPHPLTTPFLLNSEWQSNAIEMDVHGDRQCAAEYGGTDCLTREYPPGFGMKLSDAMIAFGELNDVRPLNSEPITFYVEHAFKYTRRNPGRAAGRTTVIAGLGFKMSSKPGAWHFHDDILLDFDPARPSDYLCIGAFSYRFRGTATHYYFHAHHQWTHDEWLIVHATPKLLGLHKPPFSAAGSILPSWSDWQPGGAMWANGHVPVRLAEHGMTIESVQAMLRRRIESAQPLQKGMEAPRIQCNLNHDRWEKMPDGTEQERYHAPHCDEKPWTWAPDDPFVVVAFFRPRKPVKVRQLQWAHIVLYAQYTTPDDDVNATIPHSVVLLGAKQSIFWELAEAFNALAFEIDGLRVYLGIGSDPPGIQLTSTRIFLLIVQMIIGLWILSCVCKTCCRKKKSNVPGTRNWGAYTGDWGAGRKQPLL